MGSLTKQMKKNKLPDKKSLEIAFNRGYDIGAQEMKQKLIVRMTGDFMDALESLDEAKGIGQAIKLRVIEHILSEFNKKGEANGLTDVSETR